MIRNYFIVALRTFKRHKAYSFLNIFGLTVGITSALLIFLFVNDELTYDLNHVKAGQIYRLNAAYHLPKDGGFEQYAVSGFPVGEMIAKDFPEVKQIARFRKLNDRVVVKPDSDEKLYETVIAADSNLFKMFTFPFLSGDPETALIDPFTLVLTENAARRFFNRVDVVGEALYFPEDSLEFKITGVIQNYPSNTHLKLDIITSMATLRATHFAMDSWWAYSTYTYLELFAGTDAKALEEKVRFISRNYIADQEEYSGYRQEYELQNLRDIHLHSNLRGELEPNSREAYVYIFGIIGVFILVIACINFMNLSTARSARRAKEVGIRKVSGAYRAQLIAQFISESVLMAVTAMLLSILLSALLLPYLNDVTGKALTLEVASNPFLWMTVGAIVLFVGLLAGSYPSLFLSGFKPTETLKGSFSTSSRGNVLRKSLVVFQFTISIMLITGTIIVFKHLTYLRNINLGFDKEQTVVIPTRSVNNALQDYTVLRDELKQEPGILGASVSYRIPGKEMGNNVVRIGWDDDAAWSDMRFLAVDEDFVSLYDIDVIEGRSFSREFPADENESFLLNESGMRRLGWTNPKVAVGQKLRWQNRKGYVVGIVNDFHFMSANVPVEPFIMVMNTNWSSAYLSVKISAGDPATRLDAIRARFESVLPDRIFEYFFLDDDFDQQYHAEERFLKVFTFFAVIAILIACLGLYGLAMFTAEQKFKEIGIRKVLGASSGSIVYLQVRDFIMLVSIAFLLSVPLSYFGMTKWLQTFPERENISPLIFVGSGVLSMIIAWITVSYQSIKASLINPVESIGHD
jgi:putative ABC transport system permease protein